MSIKTKSAASATIKANVKCHSISPTNANCISLTLDVKEAVGLGLRLQMLAADQTLEGKIIITGYSKNRQVSVLRREK